jgi:hypothetical protein
LRDRTRLDVTNAAEKYGASRENVRRVQNSGVKNTAAFQDGQTEAKAKEFHSHLGRSNVQLL